MYYLTEAGLEFLEEATLKQKIGAGVLATGAALGLGHKVHQTNQYNSTHDSGFGAGTKLGRGKQMPPHDFFTPAPSTQANQGTKHAEREAIKKSKIRWIKRTKPMEHRLKMHKIWPQKQFG
tara:strand:- start:1370 stop:1732 length:363 start_codon:yes stop_codon:yes gene_type:complete